MDLQQSWKWFFSSWIRNMIECTHKTNAKKSHTKATRWTNIPKMNAIRLNYQCRDTLKFRIKVKTGNLIWQHLYFSYRIENVYAFAHIFSSSCCYSSRFFDILHFCYYLILCMWIFVAGLKIIASTIFLCASYHLVVECVKPHLQFEMHASTGVIRWHV